ncbi:MAG: tRNA(Ile)-lysidine synthase [Acidobacteriaceae bacterium]|nr:tRNA(Ile)-lysidine synthase [Acidobacteriaceae bacterium]
MQHGVLSNIRQHDLLRAGDRVGVAVSGGADSVALLLALLALRSELGILLSVVHFNHQIRGAAADADQRFVADLAKHHVLEFHVGCGDAPQRAEQQKESLESAARELRYGYFRELLASGVVNKIATAHTLNDQAESVLMRFLRGAGTRGLAGIYPEKKEDKGSIVRPLLSVTRAQVEEFLNSRGQLWREDATNLDCAHTRNKVRHELLPLLASGYNPAIIEALARSAEIARGEEQYWQAETARLLPMIVLHGKPARGGGRQSTQHHDLAMSIEELKRQPLALQRRLIRAAAATLGLKLDIFHVEDVLAVADSRKACELPEGWRVQRSFRELRFEKILAVGVKSGKGHYECLLPIPGQVSVPGGNLVIHAHLLPVGAEGRAYNHRTLSDGLSGNCADNEGVGTKNLEFLYGEAIGQLQSIGAGRELVLRNWRPGDRFRPAHSGSEKKVKDLLQELKVPQSERASWPVVAAGEQLVWVRGTRPIKLWVAKDGDLHRLVIDEK